jgi:hypothetical protein
MQDCGRLDEAAALLQPRALSWHCYSLQVGDFFQGKAVVSSNGDFVADPIPHRITRLPDLMQTIKANPKSILIVDARSEEEFKGASHYGTCVTRRCLLRFFLSA